MAKQRRFACRLHSSSSPSSSLSSSSHSTSAPWAKVKLHAPQANLRLTRICLVRAAPGCRVIITCKVRDPSGLPFGDHCCCLNLCSVSPANPQATLNFSLSTLNRERSNGKPEFLRNSRNWNAGAEVELFAKLRSPPPQPNMPAPAPAPAIVATTATLPGDDERDEISSSSMDGFEVCLFGEAIGDFFIDQSEGANSSID
eukprot:CAMPEP_0206457102 /NCGR_PEP_ID=MMETSP0324_2-20121206/22763_1 /ASSEMBLY_ACC=CAM_ASM_000836 /TAXON_ID=2866 /ORGANISM="Crypthecodinium cohnii, Strain Seligo" /LENGTH=199 /DNA_ID=CAMNT_0053928163 /DNA_START=157 /DNA_END=756 /DNA_ORIENTATION=-